MYVCMYLIKVEWCIYVPCKIPIDLNLDNDAHLNFQKAVPLSRFGIYTRLGKLSPGK